VFAKEIVGVSAIVTFQPGGRTKRLDRLSWKKSDVCIGCGRVRLRVSYRAYRDDFRGDKRKNMGAHNLKCKHVKSVVSTFAPIDQLNYISKKTGTPLKK
jgi:hypothetical protein